MHISKEQGLAQLIQSGKVFLNFFRHGTLSVEIYKPEMIDWQEAHSRDEIYVIISGSGDFFLEGDTFPFKAGDFLFVPAYKEHRFMNYTQDFSTWVFFFGPDGGEGGTIGNE